MLGVIVATRHLNATKVDIETMVYLLPDVWLFVTLSDHGVFLPRCWFLNMLVLIFEKETLS